MRMTVQRWAAGIVAGWLALAAAPARGQDEVSYYNRATKKEDKASGAIKEETAGHVAIKSSTAAAAKTIPAGDIIHVVYGVAPALRPEYTVARNREQAAEKATKREERKKLLGESLAKYQDLLPKIDDAKVKRHMEFKIAKLLARQAEDDPAAADGAMAALVKFKSTHKDSWQLGAAADLLANLQIDKQDYDAAQRTYEDLAAAPNLSPEIRQEANIKVAQVMVKAKKYEAAEERLEELVKAIPPDSPQAVRLQLSLAESQAASAPEKALAAAKRLEGVLDKIGDPDLKASAYNTLGDCYQKADRKKEALWDYLWVDVVYFQNRQEHARALYHLVKLFKELNDEKRSKQYEEKLKGSQFAGLEFQKLLNDGK